MKKQFICLAIAALVWIPTLTGCGTKTENTEIEVENYRCEFTEEEKEEGYAEFALMENVQVKASVTPVEKYESGLSKYYMEQVFETRDLKTQEDFKKNPTIYGKSIKKVNKMISEKIGKISEEDAEWEFYDERVEMISGFSGRNGYPYRLVASWNTAQEEFDRTSQLYYPTIRWELERGINYCVDIGAADDVKQNLWNYETYEIGFLKDREEVGESLREFLEELTGRNVCDSWDCIPVSKQTIEKAGETVGEEWGGDDSYHRAPEEDYCEYQFYYDVAGLPYDGLNLCYELKEGESKSKMTGYTSPGNDYAKLLIALDVNSLDVDVSENGILHLNTDSIRAAGDVYKEAETVIEPEKILEQVKEHYDRKVVTKSVMITEVKLEYSGYFTDGADGEIQPAVCPYWVVTAYEGSETGSVQFVYDAFTGECMKEAA